MLSPPAEQLNGLVQSMARFNSVLDWLRKEMKRESEAIAGRATRYDELFCRNLVSLGDHAEQCHVAAVGHPSIQLVLDALGTEIDAILSDWTSIMAASRNASCPEDSTGIEALLKDGQDACELFSYRIEGQSRAVSELASRLNVDLSGKSGSHPPRSWAELVTSLLRRKQ